MTATPADIYSPPAADVTAAGPRRWAVSPGAAKAVWAVAEQGTFSLSNWLLQTLLANWLADRAEFGAFSVAFAWFLLAGTVHNALVVEPMTVYGGARYAGRLRQYLGALAGGSLAVSAAVGLALAGVGAAYAAGGDPGVAVACWSLAAAAPFVFLSWLMRRASYVSGRPDRSAAAGAGYLLAMTGGFVLLHVAGRVTVPAATAVMAISSAAAAAWLMRAERVRRPGADVDPGTGNSLVTDARRDHWRFGRWAVLTGLAVMVVSQWYFLAAPWFVGVEAGGALRALTNLFQPVMQAIVAFTAVLVPALARAAGTPRYGQLLRRAAALTTVGPAAAWLAGGLAAGPLVGLVYHGRYAEQASLLWLIGLQPVAAGAMMLAHARLCLADRPDRMFVASAASLAFTLTAGTALMYAGGLWGVAAAMPAAMAVDAAVSWYFVRAATAKGTPANATGAPAAAGQENR
ncbi:MAG: Membrane protein involved in the export of O-antigen and teichoic acid-like protein [Phycisphaerales bacterium]|nr:Membrane protein involved in the export of O-antigen and teichoic acid-like protein [Phycisphaerales bacterium]